MTSKLLIEILELENTAISHQGINPNDEHTVEVVNKEDVFYLGFKLYSEMQDVSTNPEIEKMEKVTMIRSVEWIEYLGVENDYCLIDVNISKSHENIINNKFEHYEIEF